MTGFPVIFVVSLSSIRTCPVTEAAPQASVALMKADQWIVADGGPLISSAAFGEHALLGGDHGAPSRLNLWSKYVT